MRTYTHCPICDCSDLVHYNKTQDYSVSKEIFSISKCQNCHFIFTNPVPEQSNIGKYYASTQYVSHSDTNVGIVNKLYHYIRNFTLKQKLNLIESINKNDTKRLLDFGCGTGYFLNKAHINGWEVEGFEPDESAKTITEKKINKTVTSDLHTLENKTFDIITLWHVLEHVHYLNETITFLKNRLAANGKMIVAVPNIESWDSLYYKDKWAALDVPRHLYHFSKKSISLLFKKNGMRLVDTKGMIFDSFYVSMLSEKYLNKRNNPFTQMVASLIVGIISNLKAFKKPNHSSLIYIFEKNA